MNFESEVIEIIERTHDVKSFRFSRPLDFNYKAGQFMFVTIPNNKKGELRKHFTISSSPTEKEFIEFTKKLSDSDYSKALRVLAVRDEVKLDAPYGRFFLDEEVVNVAMLSGGIGITPLRSMCKYVTDMKLDKNIILLYGNNTIDDIAFMDEFESLQMQNKNLKVVHVLNKPPSDWKGYTGFIDAALIKKVVSDYKNRIFYTCGPPGMISAMKRLLQELNVPGIQIKTENFTGY